MSCNDAKVQKGGKVVGRLCRICSTAATWRPACRLISPPSPSDLTRLASAHTFPCLHAHWRKACGRKPLQSEAVQQRHRRRKPTKSFRNLLKLVHVKTSIHFPHLENWLYWPAARAKGTKMRQFIKRWWLYSAARKQEKTFILYLWTL